METTYGNHTNGRVIIMKLKYISAVGIAILALNGFAQQLNSNSATVYNYFSEEKDNPAWQKDIITADGENYSNLRDRQGVIAAKQEAIAIEVAASNLIHITQAYNLGFQKGIANLVAATNGIPETGFTFGLVLPLVPGETRTAIEGFIVEQEYSQDFNTDILTIHFTQSLAVQPKIVCPYIYESGFTTNLLAGTFRDMNFAGSNWTNVYTVVKGEVTYDNCHKLYVPRPAALAGYTASYDSHVRYGTDEGINYGSIVHTAFGEPLFSGILTNHINHTYVVIKDGAIMEPGFISYEP